MKKAILFTASYCGPCKTVKTAIERNGTKIPVEYVSVEEDEGQVLAATHKIKKVPMLLVLEDDVVKDLISDPGKIINAVI